MESDMTMGQPHDEQQENAKSHIVRDVQAPYEARAALVKFWQDKVRRAKVHWKPSFDRMREDMDFFMGKQWPAQTEKDDRYVANIVQRHVSQRVSALYAKNPKFVAKRRDVLDFTVWNGSMSDFQNAKVAFDQAAATMTPVPPQVQALISDVEAGMQRRSMLDKVARTMEIVAHHQVAEQQPNFKSQMKQAVRRACVAGVAYAKIGYHRVMQKRPDDVDRINDITEQLATLERLMADAHDKQFDDNSAKAEQLRQLLAELMEKEDQIVREGVVYDFPAASSVIPDPKCRQLSGFVGADWVAQEFILGVDEVKEIYKIDLGKGFTAFEDPHARPGASDEKSDPRAVVWEIYSKKDGLMYVVADGFPEFLREPDEPDIKLDRFWPFFTLIFNEVESDKDIFPPSDVRLLTPIQREYNRARQSLREHRYANRPKYAAAMGALSETDKENLQNHNANAVIQLQNLGQGQSVDSILQPIKGIPIDPAIYDTEILLNDMMRVVGSQEANLGATGNSTATEVSVAEGSRLSSLSSNVDDLEEFLKDLARATGKVLLAQMDPETVTRIAGPGAVWPKLTASDIASELLLEIEAGSNGRPNKAVEMQNFRELAPILLQIPGVTPDFLAEEAIKRLDDGLDVKDVIRAGLPSIVAMNAAKNLGQPQPSTGDPASDPVQQGPQGGLNADAPGQAAGADGPTPPPTPGQIRAGNVPTP